MNAVIAGPMCGIAALLNMSPVAGFSAEMEHMLKAQQHRGPDHQGWKQVAANLALGSVRLSITDHANPAANMPLSSPCGRYTIVFNGEIYNHRALRSELDYAFSTHSDTETLLAAYMQWGEDMLPRLEGMFAFCIYDEQTGELFCAVDPAGQKFLYLYKGQDAFLMASEIEPLITNPYRSKSWNVPALRECVSQRMINGPETHIREIEKLEAGACMWLSATGEIRRKRYHTYPLGDQSNRDKPAICKSITTAIAQGCAETFDLEVPYGHLLSGGIDSSAVTHYAKAAGLNLHTYSIGFMPFAGETHGIPSTFNEFEYSRFVSEYLGTTHTEITLSPEEYRQNIDKWLDICGEPLESAEAPMLVKLFEVLSQKHKVIFSGSGPDEAFDGYGYGQALADVAPEDIAGAYFDRFNWSFGVDLDKAIPHHAEVRQHVVARINRQLEPYRARTQNPLQLVQLIHMHNRLVNYEFRQMDVISMRHGVEVRSPLADSRLYKAAFNFAPELKAEQGVEKWIYKESLRGILPDQIIDRKKEGFPTPIEFWFSNEFESCMAEIMESGSLLFSLGIVDEAYMRSVYANSGPEHRYFFYRLYCLHKLLQRQAQWVG